MKRLVPRIVLVILLLMPICFAACYQNPATEREPVVLADDATISNLALQQYHAFLSANPPIVGTTNTEMVKRTGARLAIAVHAYMSSIGRADIVRQYKWEFNLIDNPHAAIWCMPGGKMVVYRGIMPFTQTEVGLAALMSHEIAHCIARHGNERLSQMLQQQFSGIALSSLLTTRPAETQAIYNSAYGISSPTYGLTGTSYGIGNTDFSMGTRSLGTFPYSRRQEYEADEMGIYIMALAGYDPGEAVNFWGHMAERTGSGIPDFLNTHSADRSRVQHLKDLMPRAMDFYQGTMAVAK